MAHLIFVLSILCNCLQSMRIPIIFTVLLLIVCCQTREKSKYEELFHPCAQNMRRKDLFCFLKKLLLILKTLSIQFYRNSVRKFVSSDADFILLPSHEKNMQEVSWSAEYKDANDASFIWSDFFETWRNSWRFCIRFSSRATGLYKNCTIRRLLG